MSESLRGKTIIVTGGAGLLGKEICRKIAENGGVAVIADRDYERAVGIAASINEPSVSGEAVPASVDINASDSISKLLSVVSEKHGDVNGLVNSAYPRNARYGSKLEDVTYEDFVENVSLHLGGYFLMMKEFALFCREKGIPGSTVNISSIYGVVAPRFEVYEGTPMTMPVEYAAIKSALIHLNRYFAKYFRNTGMRFNSISPGGIKDKQPDSFLEKYRALSLSKGMLDPGDLTGGILFLLSDESKYINGQNIIIDDGWSL